MSRLSTVSPRFVAAVAAVVAIAGSSPAATAKKLRARVDVKRAFGGKSAKRAVGRSIRAAARSVSGVSVKTRSRTKVEVTIEVRVTGISSRRRRRGVRRRRSQYRLSVSVRNVATGKVMGRSATRMRHSRPTRLAARRVTRRAIASYRAATRRLARVRRRKAADRRRRSALRKRQAADRRRRAIVRKHRAGPDAADAADAADAPDETTLVADGGGNSDPAGGVAGAGGEDVGSSDSAAAGANGSSADDSDASSGTFDADWDVKPVSFSKVSEDTNTSEVVTKTSGTVVVDHYRYFDDRGPTDDTGMPTGSEELPGGRDAVELVLETRASAKNASAVAKLSVRHDLSDPDRDRVGLVEGYGSFSKSSVNVRAGLLVESWGTANLHNPTDILNPVDLRDPIDPEKLGTWMVKVGWLSGPWSIEGYYLPIPDPHTLPQVEGITADGTLLGQSRWVNGSIAGAGEGGEANYILGTIDLPRPTLSNAQGAVRAAMSGNGRDFSVSYAYVFNHFATAVPKMVGAGTQPTVQLNFAYPRQHVLAAEAETTVGKYRLAAEVAAFIPAGKPVEDPLSMAEDSLSYFSGTIGFDYRTAQFNDDHSIQVFVDLTLTQGISAALPDDPMSRLQFPLRRAVLGRVEYEAGRDLRLRVDVVESLDHFGLLVRPAVSYTIASMIEAELGVSWLDGNKDTFFGANSNNSRVSARLEARF